MIVVITLLALGALLLFLEVFLPGMIAGIVGFACLLAAVFVGYNEFGFQTGNYILGGVLVGLVVGTWCWLKFFPESRLARRFIAQNAVGELGTDRPELVGCSGEALTQLRPCGMALINGKRVDVVTEGALIEKGTRLRVVAVEGLRVVVREV
jgi:membrane-bound serine protease (ClpP class)